MTTPPDPTTTPGSATPLDAVTPPDSTLPDPATLPESATPGPSDPTGDPAPVHATGRRRRSARHIVALVIGCLVLLSGLGMLAGGGAIAVGQAVATDDAGYFRFTPDRVESDGVAITTTVLRLDDVGGDASPWLFDWLDLDIRLRVQGATATDEVFVGIARSADVERFLSGATYSEVVELDDRTPRYQEVTGGVRPIGPPAAAGFWTVSATGAGEQELTWTARGGSWSVVVMNADGSPVVSADVELGARSGAVTPIAITLFIVGGVVTVAAIVLIVVGARGRRSPDSPSPAVPVSPSPSPSPTPSPSPSRSGPSRSSDLASSASPSLPPPGAVRAPVPVAGPVTTPHTAPEVVEERHVTPVG